MIYVVTLAVILAFPTGRLDGVVERVLLACAAIGVTALYVVSLTLIADDRPRRHDLGL